MKRISTVPASLAVVLGILFAACLAMTIAFGVLWGEAKSQISPPNLSVLDPITGCRVSNQAFLNVRDSYNKFKQETSPQDWIFDNSILTGVDISIISQWPNWTAPGVQIWETKFNTTRNNLINANVAGLTEYEKSELRAIGESALFYFHDPFREKHSTGSYLYFDQMCGYYAVHVHAFGFNLVEFLAGPEVAINHANNFATSMEEYLGYFQRAFADNIVVSELDVDNLGPGCEFAIESYTPNIVDTVAYAPFISASPDQQTRAQAAFARVRTAVNAFIAYIAPTTPYHNKVLLNRANSNSPGLASLPPSQSGEYQRFISIMTSSTRTPEEIYNLGLAQVAEIQADIVSKINTYLPVAALANFADFKNQLETNETFRSLFQETITVQQHIDRSRTEISAINSILFNVFQYFPRSFSLYEILPFVGFGYPSYVGGKIAQDFTGTVIASPPIYNHPSLSSTDPIDFNEYINVTNGVYEAIGWHEGFPGHIYQTAIEVELPCSTNTQEFRPGATEGWALYAELVARDDLGRGSLPQNIFRYLGGLSQRLLRAVRLVVDPGIHHYGWSRQQAIDYMIQNNFGESTEYYITDTDRYISWPGQSLAYLLGSIDLEAERSRAQTTLGSEFSLREWHDVILRYWAPYRKTMTERTDFYIESKQNGTFTSLWPPQAPSPEIRKLNDIRTFPGVENAQKRRIAARNTENMSEKLMHAEMHAMALGKPIQRGPFFAKKK